MEQRKLSMIEVDALVAEELTTREAERRAEVTAAEVARRLALIDGFGDDTFSNGAILRFRKTHTKMNGVQTVYTYAALKANDAWYVTGEFRNPGKLAWDGLKAFIVAGDDPTDSIEILRFDTMLHSNTPALANPWSSVVAPGDEYAKEPPF